MAQAHIRDRTGHVTTLLKAINRGHDAAKDELCRLLYDELRSVARNLFPQGGGPTLQPTALVHEVMVRLLDRNALQKLSNRRSFFAVAIGAMKQILVDHHRTRKRLKRGGDRQRQSLDSVLDTIEQETDTDFEDLYSALEDLKGDSLRQYEVVQLRFFGGLTINETAEMLGLSTATVERDWNLARAKLFVALRGL